MQQNNYKQAAIEEASFEVSIDDEESLASEVFKRRLFYNE